MTRRVAFCVDGRPKGKARARFRPDGGRPFTPKATVEAEKAIAEAYREAAPGAPLMTGTVVLSIDAVFAVPKGWSRRLRSAAIAGEVEYTGKPDRDNIEKLIKDALNGVAWLDDAQVNRGPTFRRYGMAERVEIVVEEREAAPGLKSPAERRREKKRDEGPPARGRSRTRAPRGSKSLAIPDIGKRIR